MYFCINFPFHFPYLSCCLSWRVWTNRGQACTYCTWGSLGHYRSASVFHVEKYALLLEKHARAGGSWNPWQLWRGLWGGTGDHMPRVVFVQPFSHLCGTAAATWARHCALAAFPVCFLPCGFSCFASVRVSGWYVVSEHSVLLLGLV